jgi:Aflatoxin regulatory protein
MATSTESDDDLIQTVLTKNKQSIEAVNSMLACSCAEDGFLLTILSMIVLKMLGAYAAAARAQLHVAGAETGEPTILTNSIIFSDNDQLRRLSSSYDAPSDENGSERMAAQLVLGELHRVQRLVNQLSPRLQGALEERERESRSEQDLWSHQRVMAESEPVTMAPFSASTLDQVESDLRKSLSNLSAGIISRLRQS